MLLNFFSMHPAFSISRSSFNLTSFVILGSMEYAAFTFVYVQYKEGNTLAHLFLGKRATNGEQSFSRDDNSYGMVVTIKLSETVSLTITEEDLRRANIQVGDLLCSIQDVERILVPAPDSSGEDESDSVEEFTLTLSVWASGWVKFRGPSASVRRALERLEETYLELDDSEVGDGLPVAFNDQSPVATVNVPQIIIYLGPAA